MATILFWNLNKRPIADLVAALAYSRQVDLLILAESEIPTDTLMQVLNSGSHSLYLPDPGASTHLQIFSRYVDQYVQPLRDSGGIAIRHVQPPVSTGFLLVAVHLMSKLHHSEEDQLFACSRLARMIRDAEQNVGHMRTLVVGDFNMMPFESGLVAGEGMHAMSDQGIVRREWRSIQGERRHFFYNPMWSHLGDITPGPPGTYYRDTGGQVNFYWHMFDQVLIGHDLLAGFRDEDLEIVTEVGGISLLTSSGRPSATVGSDHLPVVLALNLEEVYSHD